VRGGALTGMSAAIAGVPINAAMAAAAKIVLLSTRSPVRK